MAEHHQLQYWLESINLSQYYTNFSQNDILTYEGCLTLDEDKLTNIGVTLPGHQRRILTHLPTEETWSENVLPNLPPKKKSARDSFLFKDGWPNLAKESTEAGNTQKASSPLGQQDGSPKQNTLLPKPVPRPRSHKPKSPVPHTEVKPKPAPRPAPRKHSPLGSTSGTSESPQSAEETNSVSQTTEEVSTESQDSEGHIPDQSDFNFDLSNNNSDGETEIFENSENLDTSKQIVSESLTGNLTLVESSNIDLVLNETANRSVNASDRPLTVTLDGACVGETETEESTDNAEHDDEVYVNIDAYQTNCKSDRIPDTSSVEVLNDVSATVGNKQGMAVESSGGTKKSGYVNIDFDGQSLTSKVKLEQMEKDDHCKQAKQPEEAPMRPKPKPVPEQIENVDENVSYDANEDSIYEPIWGNDKNNKPEASVRSSNLMMFSPQERKSLDRFSTFGIRSSFNFPPPEFPPPPLPPTEKSDPAELLRDFDPLAVPQVPPRPQNYHPPKFNIYQNVGFHSSGGSTTLPGMERNMEPDTLCSPNPIGYQDAAVSITADPFNTVDPFGEFTPDESDFHPESFPPSSCQSESSDKTFVNPMTGSSFENSFQMPNIYEVAQEPFDPFGLNKAREDAGLTRSVSSSSGNSGPRLSEVPPAPRWPHTIPEGNWFHHTNTDSMYSLADDISKCY